MNFSALRFERVLGSRTNLLITVNRRFYRGNEAAFGCTFAGNGKAANPAVRFLN